MHLWFHNRCAVRWTYTDLRRTMIQTATISSGLSITTLTMPCHVSTRTPSILPVTCTSCCRTFIRNSTSTTERREIMIIFRHSLRVDVFAVDQPSFMQWYYLDLHTIENECPKSDFILRRMRNSRPSCATRAWQRDKMHK